jgi:hypothetical protein
MADETTGREGVRAAISVLMEALWSRLEQALDESSRPADVTHLARIARLCAEAGCLARTAALATRSELDPDSP